MNAITLPAFPGVTSAGAKLPNRYLIYAVEGWGKTSLGAKFPAPVFLQSKGETGLETLIDAGQLPETPHFAECMKYEAVKEAVQALIDAEAVPFKTVVIDTLNGVERLVHEFVCDRDFGGDFGEKAFAGYGRGYKASIAPFRELLALLDRLRAKHKVSIVMLAHTKIAQFKNPEGSDYNRYQADMHETTYGMAAKWADLILFGNFETVVTDERNGKGKAKGCTRMLYAERRAAYDAKNRLGLPAEISMGSSPDDAWANLASEIKRARGGK
jgi:hypothetical protein